MQKYVVTVRGKLKDRDENAARKAHDDFVAKVSPMGKTLGSIGHQTHLNPQSRGEFLAIDTWDNIEGPQKLFADPQMAAGFFALFDGQPDVTIWEATDWFGY